MLSVLGLLHVISSPLYIIIKLFLSVNIYSSITAFYSFNCIFILHHVATRNYQIVFNNFKQFY